MNDIDALVVGAGPAGLMAAEVLSAAGQRVVILEAKATPARKFLMAGKSGLNLTKAESFDAFAARYDSDWLTPILRSFDNQAVMDWARGLGVELFAGTTGRVFPVEMKASRLLRAWLARLDRQGVRLLSRHRVSDLGTEFVVVETPEGQRRFTAPVVILALGGASWSRLGSDGHWADLLRSKGVDLRPFQASNAGLSVDWSAHMTKHFGQPVKGTRLIAGSVTGSGEFVVTNRGLEGGGIYEMNAAIRSGQPLTLDLLPGLTVEQITTRLAQIGTKESLSNRLRKALKLDPIKQALFLEFSTNRNFADLKQLPVRHHGLRPIDEAISTAGGIARTALDDTLMIRQLPGIYACGEMLDWDAPTGGYLLTACLASGHWVGQAILARRNGTDC